MEALKQRIQRDGKIRGNNEVLKVDSFLNHQMDVAFLEEIGREFRRRFAGCQVDRILTIEASGIGIACLAAPAFDHVPVYDVILSKKFLQPEDHVLIIDDFLANGSALSALIDLVHQAGAQVVGAGIVIEKAFQPGGALIRGKGVRVESLARIESMDEEDGITFCD